MKIIKIAQTPALKSCKPRVSPLIEALAFSRQTTQKVPGLAQILCDINTVSKSGDLPAFNNAANEHILHNLQYLVSLNKGTRGLNNLNRILSTLSVELIDLAKTSGVGDASRSVLRAENPIDIEGDCKDIVEAYSSRGRSLSTTKQEQYPMFRALLGKFSNEIKKSANSIGSTVNDKAEKARCSNLLNAINNNGLINPQAFMQQKFELGKPLGHMYSNSEALLHDVMSKRYIQTPRNVEQNYAIIREKFMSSVGNYSLGEMQKTDIDRKVHELKQVQDPKSIAPGANAGKPQKPLELSVPVNFDDKKMTNPFFIMALVVFFTEYYKKIKSLP